ncbi:MAG: type II toxin-antitoxin system HicA family toxin [Planctomycetes bacterium]|nr:type II toxin-antitoxin system HicA family toxin [Planctomycetota bacterium]
MKRRDLEQHLRNHDCELLRHGNKHDVWINTATLRKTTIPRHNEIKSGTVLAICKRLGVPAPN